MNLNSVDTVDDVRRGGKGPGAGIDQNRLFLGINKTFNQYFNVDLGSVTRQDATEAARLIE